MPDHLTVGIYNAAGELVRTLYQGNSQAMPGNFSESTGTFVALSGSVTLNFGGELQGGAESLVWNGTNNSGQGVSGGTYTIKVTNTDAFGSVQTWAQSVNVLPQPPKQTLNVYNSAGELVATLDISAYAGTPITQIGFPASSHAAFSLGQGGGVPIQVQDSSGATSTLVWNGKSGTGALVSSGSYTLELTSNSGGNNSVTMSKSFEVLDAPGAGGFTVVEGPNPVGPLDSDMVFQVNGLGSGQGSVLRLYNLAGELVAQGVDSGGNGRIVLKVGNWSAGIYVAVVEACQGSAVLSRKLSKVVIQR
jgi:flagellar hook assembly protein FlgD